MLVSMDPRDSTAPAEQPTHEVALVDSHRAFLAFLERHVGDRSTAEDLLQEAFVRAMPHVASLGDDEPVRRWFYRVLRNAAIDHHRRAKSRSRALQALAAHLESAEAEPSRELDAELCRCMTSLSRALKPEYAHALQRIDLEGTAVKDYAAEVGISANNAAVRVFRARKALREELVRACGTCAEHGCLECTCTPGTSSNMSDVS